MSASAGSFFDATWWSASQHTDCLQFSGSGGGGPGIGGPGSPAGSVAMCQTGAEECGDGE